MWKWTSLSLVWLSGTPRTIQSMGFSRPEYWSVWPFPSPWDPPDPGIEPRSPAVQADALPAEPQLSSFHRPVCSPSCSHQWGAGFVTCQGCFLYRPIVSILWLWRLTFFLRESLKDSFCLVIEKWLFVVCTHQRRPARFKWFSCCLALKRRFSSS